MTPDSFFLHGVFGQDSVKYYYMGQVVAHSGRLLNGRLAVQVQAALSNYCWAFKLSLQPPTDTVQQKNNPRLFQGEIYYRLH